ncbi:MAG: hypothetical protein H7Y31_18600 [Chitinophagaceae bacterium]|nr:hypothetical protein [Chitinophagaceae bacterium]
MSTSNYPSATPQSQPPRKDSKNLIIALLAVGILGTWGYFLYDKNKSDKSLAQVQKEYVTVDSSKNELEKSYSAALGRLDSLTGFNNELEGKLTERNSDIKKLRGRIDGLIRKQNLSAAEKKEAAKLISELNEKITSMEAEVVRLTTENTELNTNLTSEKEKTTQLSTDLQTTTTAKQELEQKVDVASTLNASNIAITPINEKNGKEKVTSTAKRVDKLMISFDVDNRIVQSGSTDVFVVITSPDGKPVSVEALGSGSFTTREEGEKVFTAKVPVEFEQGKRKKVEFAWKQNSDFQRGNYKIEVFHNGFKIGEGIRELKKGGLFS